MTADSIAPQRWQGLLARIADAGDAIALRYFRRPGLEVNDKADASPVTRADLEIEQAARDIVCRHQPELGVLGEELGAAGSAGSARLIIDPIDATANFACGIPLFATLLAIEADGEIIAGLVSAPALATRWSAIRGRGAWRNDERIAVSGVGVLSNAQVFHTGLKMMGRHLPGFIALARAARRDRGFGDFYQHMLVAEGAGEIAVDFDLDPWDIAALLVIVEEAGARATSVAGERTIYAGSFVTSNGLLHEAALALLGQHPTGD